jgi:hypothetical protein
MTDRQQYQQPTKITVRDLQHLASSKEHMVQALDMEGEVIRILHPS